MHQTPMLPVICTRTRPPPATAAADFIGIDEATTHRWLCKGQGRHSMVPAAEWLCSHLTHACGLPVPVWAVVERFDQPGVSYFGSQWQGGAREFIEVMGRISNADVFARTHAVDLFVNNIDRHQNNFLYLDLAGEVVARVIDFSHALVVLGWPLPALPMPECNTTNALPALLMQDPSGYVKPSDIIQRIGDLPDEWLRDTFQRMPASWLPKEKQIAMRQWWCGAGRHNRLAAAHSTLP